MGPLSPLHDNSAASTYEVKVKGRDTEEQSVGGTSHSLSTTPSPSAQRSFDRAGSIHCTGRSSSERCVDDEELNEVTIIVPPHQRLVRATSGASLARADAASASQRSQSSPVALSSSTSASMMTPLLSSSSGSHNHSNHQQLPTHFPQSKVIHFIDTPTGTTLFKAKVPIPLAAIQQGSCGGGGGATMKDLAKVALKRLVAAHRIPPAVCSIRGMQILGNGASLCASDTVHAVVGADEEVVFMTNISDTTVRARLLSSPATAGQQSSVAASTVEGRPDRKRERSGVDPAGDKGEACSSNSRASRTRARIDKADFLPVNTTATAAVVTALVAATPSGSGLAAPPEVKFSNAQIEAAATLVNKIVTEQLISNLFAHVQSSRRSLTLVAQR